MIEEVEDVPIGAQFPEITRFLFDPKRFKIAYGGRGAAKSWNFARALLIKGYQSKKRILCCREYQNTLADSSHQLLQDQIRLLDLTDHYRIFENKIEGANGTKFRFFGLRKQFNEIASFEAIDIVWVEEANTTSKASWTKLIPTIRKDGSEIWVSFNPELDTDETYKLFVVNTPPDAAVVKMTWQHNPWFPKVLNEARLHDRRTKPEDEYLHVWEGQCLRWLEGAVFAEEMRAAELAGRITKVPYFVGSPVDTVWDLGRGDNTSIWFRQRVGMEWRYIDFYENNRKHISHYLEELQRRSYVYGTHYLPHDGEAEQLGSKMTVEEQVRAVFPGKVRVIPAQSTQDQLNAARTTFPNSYFDQEKCTDGLQHLRYWKYKIDPHTRQRNREPEHDIHSHASKAYIYSALTSLAKVAKKLDLEPPVERRKVQLGDLSSSANQAWMG